jgi:hypothetical protein
MSTELKPCPKCGNPDVFVDSSGIASASWVDCDQCEFRFQQSCCEETLEKRWNKLDRKDMPAFTDAEEQG